MLSRSIIALCVLAATGSAQGIQEEAKGPDLLSVTRIAKLPWGARMEWRHYIERSRRLHAADSAAMQSELIAVGRAAMTKAPYAAPDFRFGERGASWFATDSAQTLAQSILTWQTQSGGWSKRTDMWKPRERGTSFYSETESWHYTPTFDNGSTTGQLRFLAEMTDATGMNAYAKPFERGLALVFAAQEPNGCWPQTYPLEGGYHDAATFNDDVTVLVLRLLDDVASGRWAFVPTDARARAAAAARKGVSCLVRSQIVVDGARTVWGQQHDPLTLAIVPARKYELAGLAGRESASIMMYLMSLQHPSAAVKRAVNSAATWFERHAVRGFRYDGYNLTPDSSAGRLWPRLTEMSTDRPIFANRDGVKLYDWEKLTDRRSGYGWFGSEPAQALARYGEWKKENVK